MANCDNKNSKCSSNHYASLKRIKKLINENNMMLTHLFWLFHAFMLQSLGVWSQGKMSQTFLIFSMFISNRWIIHGVNLRNPVRFYCFIFNIATYEQLSTTGYCSLSTTVSQLHENCIYQGAGVSTVCKSYCDNDNMCKGYDYRETGTAQCCFYTTASCPSGITMAKANIGNTGVLVNYASSSWSGCFKKTGKHFY